jgi:hypothetical protein
MNVTYRVIADGDWYVVVRDEGPGFRVLARYLDELEANRVRSACEQATGGGGWRR